MPYSQINRSLFQRGSCFFFKFCFKKVLDKLSYVQPMYHTTVFFAIMSFSLNFVIPPAVLRRHRGCHSGLRYCLHGSHTELSEFRPWTLPCQQSAPCRGRVLLVHWTRIRASMSWRWIQSSRSEQARSFVRHLGMHIRLRSSQKTESMGAAFPT